VDGHSPWKPEDKVAKPICIDDIEKSRDLPEELKAVVSAERIAALAFIPVFANGKVAGKFMAYYDAPHVFSPREVDAGITIARQLGFGLERVRAEEAMRRLASIVETSDDAIISKNLDGVIQSWNGGAKRIFGYTAEEVVGKPVTILMPPERYDEEPEILARLRRGERIDHYQTVRRRKDGTLIDISLTVSPLTDKAGRVIAASKIAQWPFVLRIACRTGRPSAIGSPRSTDASKGEIVRRFMPDLVRCSSPPFWSLPSCRSGDKRIDERPPVLPRREPTGTKPFRPYTRGKSERVAVQLSV
jgi:PAS domain S-box-containing protein